MDKIKVDPILVNVLNIFKTEIQEKYGVICLQSMHYRNNHLFLYDISSSVKELWEDNQPFDHISFIECVCIQLRIMEMMGITFYALSMEDIYVLHGKPIFIMVGEIIKLNNDKFTLLTPSFKYSFDEYLFYPEMMKKKLPLTCHKSVIYYSIGLIVFAFKIGYPEWKNGYYHEGEAIADCIEKISGKLYYFLRRCFQYELLYL